VRLTRITRPEGLPTMSFDKVQRVAE